MKLRSNSALMFAAGMSCVFAGANSVLAVAPAASSTIYDTFSAGVYTYNVTVQDSASSTLPIGTYWFAWVPGKDFLTTPPASIVTPAGWTANVTHGGATDGYAIQWIAGSAAADVTAGNSLGFSFTSVDPPSSVFGNSSAFPTFLTTTSVAYEGAPFSDSGATFAATVVPEPVTIGLLSPVALLLGRRRRKI